MTEQALERLLDWLRTAPSLADLPLGVDDLSAVGESAGAFPLGIEMLSRRENLLGQVTLRCRTRCTLRLILPLAPGDAGQGTRNAGRLLELQDWVAQQSAAGLAPTFGNIDSTAERMAASSGRLERRSDEGTAVYTVELTAEYTLFLDRKKGEPET